MKILILNSSPLGGDPKFDQGVSQLAEALKEIPLRALENKKIRVDHLSLRHMDLKDCIGCYACWLKTPGVCVLKDDMHKVLDKFVKADVVIHASPVKIGFISPLCKRIRDRLLPLVHPYLKIDKDRMTHLGRYDKLPLQLVALNTVEDIDHIRSMYGSREQKEEAFYSIFDKEGITHAITNH